MSHWPLRKKKLLSFRMRMALDLLAQPHKYLHQRGRIRWEIRKDGTMVHHMTAAVLLEHGLVERRGRAERMDYKITQKGRDALVDGWWLVEPRKPGDA